MPLSCSFGAPPMIFSDRILLGYGDTREKTFGKKLLTYTTVEESHHWVIPQENFQRSSPPGTDGVQIHIEERFGMLVSDTSGDCVSESLGRVDGIPWRDNRQDVIGLGNEIPIRIYQFDRGGSGPLAGPLAGGSFRRVDSMSMWWQCCLLTFYRRRWL